MAAALQCPDCLTDTLFLGHLYRSAKISSAVFRCNVCRTIILRCASTGALQVIRYDAAIATQSQGLI